MIAFYTKCVTPVELLVVVIVLKAKRQVSKLKCSRRAPGYYTLIGDKAPPATHDSSQGVRG